MKSSKHIELSSQNVEKITALFPTKIFKAKSTLFYEGQIPISGYLVVLGTIQITKKKKFKKLLSTGTLVGISDLMNKTPSSICVEVFPNTQICFLDKTTLMEMWNLVDHELSKILQNLIVEKI